MVDNLTHLNWTDRNGFDGPDFEYKGYQHFTSEDLDDDCFWSTTHYAVSPSGERHILGTRLSTSPMTFDNFMKQVDDIIKGETQ